MAGSARLKRGPRGFGGLEAEAGEEARTSISRKFSGGP